MGAIIDIPETMARRTSVATDRPQYLFKTMKSLSTGSSGIAS